eukprot:5468203-Prymnesium_polylepis.1
MAQTLWRSCPAVAMIAGVMLTGTCSSSGTSGVATPYEAGILKGPVRGQSGLGFPSASAAVGAVGFECQMPRKYEW